MARARAGYGGAVAPEDAVPGDEHVVPLSRLSFPSRILLLPPPPRLAPTNGVRSPQPFLVPLEDMYSAGTVVLVWDPGNIPAMAGGVEGHCRIHGP